MLSRTSTFENENFNPLVNEKESLQNYLTYIYYDLLTHEPVEEDAKEDRETPSSTKMMSLKVFKKYLTYASLVSEHMFRVFDKFTRGKLTLEDFSQGLIDLLTNEPKKLTKLIFEVCDFNWYNRVFLEDVKLFLIYLDPRRDGEYRYKYDKSLLEEFEDIIYDNSDFLYACNPTNNKRGSSTSLNKLDKSADKSSDKSKQLTLQEFERLFLNSEIIFKIRNLIHEGIPLCLDNLKVFKKEVEFNETVNQVQVHSMLKTANSVNSLNDKGRQGRAESRSKSPVDRHNMYRFDSVDIGETGRMTTKSRDPSSRNKLPVREASREATTRQKVSMFNSEVNRAESRNNSKELTRRKSSLNHTSAIREMYRQSSRDTSNNTNNNLKTVKTREESSRSPFRKDENANSNNISSTSGGSRKRDSSENLRKSDENENDSEGIKLPVQVNSTTVSSKIKKSKFCTNNNENSDLSGNEANLNKNSKFKNLTIQTDKNSLSRSNTDQPLTSPMNKNDKYDKNDKNSYKYQEAYEDVEKFSLNLNKDVSERFLKPGNPMSRQNSNNSTNSRSRISPNQKKSINYSNTMTTNPNINNISSSNENFENDKTFSKQATYQDCNHTKIIYQGFVYKKTKEDKLRKFYIVFVNKDIIYFNSTREKFRG